MKKGLTTLLLIFSMMSISFAHQSEIFQINEEKINNELSELYDLESFLNNNPDLTASFLLNNPSLYPNIDLINDQLKISGFMWGFITGTLGGCMGITLCYFPYIISPIGILIAYLNYKEDTKQITNSILGCLAGTVLGTGVGLGINFGLIFLMQM